MEEHERRVRIPQQKRSIEKKARIVQAAYEVFSRQGYNNTSTPQIAQAAGISTGTLYAYYQDKKELFLEAYKTYSTKLLTSIWASYEALKPGGSVLDILEKSLTILLETHNVERNFHKEMMSMFYQDEDVRAYYFELHERIINTIIEQFQHYTVSPEFGREKVFLLMSLVESISREITYNPRSTLDAGTLIELCKTIIHQFQSTEQG